jgi:hypothetical protein
LKTELPDPPSEYIKDHRLLLKASGRFANERIVSLAEFGRPDHAIFAQHEGFDRRVFGLYQDGFERSALKLATRPQ